MTLDLTTHFLARGQVGSPLDAHVELVKQTRGHAFLQGVVKQDGETLLQLQRHAEAGEPSPTAPRDERTRRLGLRRAGRRR